MFLRAKSLLIFLLLSISVGPTIAYSESPSDASSPDVSGVSQYDEAVAAAKSSMMGAPNTALKQAQAAEVLAANASSPQALATSLWLQGEALTRLNKPEEAEPVISRALEFISDETSKLAGDLLLAKGRAERVLGKDGAALSSFQSAYTIFQSLDEFRSQALALQSIGTLYDNARQYERVIVYYARASEVFSDDAMLDMVSLNNRANAFRELGQYDKARPLLERALAMAVESDSNLLQARILTNIATLETRSRKFTVAEKAIKKGFLYVDNDDSKGWEPFLWGARAQLEFARGDTLAARDALEKTFDGIVLTDTLAPFRDFHDTAYNVYLSLGETTLAIQHLAAFKRLDDDGRDVAASANFALLNAEFESANKELEIQKLRSVQLENDFALANAEATQGRLVALVVFVISSGIVIFLAWSYFTSVKAHKVVQNFNDELEIKNEELSSTNIALEKANQAKMEFLATTSHEIRTPLNAIIGLTDVVLNGGAVIDRDHEYLEMVSTSGKNLLHVVNDILEVAKLESGRLVIEECILDIAECILDVAELWRNPAEEKGLKFVVEVDENLGCFLTDERLLRQIVSNLLSNAIKFTQIGRIKISTRLIAEGGFYISVIDTGIGMAPDKCDLAFEPFQQIDSSLRREFEGAGLGLAICKKITEALGGEIQVESELARGSEFNVLIPAKRGDEKLLSNSAKGNAKAEQAEIGNRSGLSELRILVAEDNIANALVIRALLESHVADVEIVENGAEALRAAQEKDFDLILMDKRMPIMDGIAATKAIRMLNTNMRNIPIIAVTADAFSGAERICLEAGMDGYVSKPVNILVLLQVIMDTLQSRRIEAVS